MQTINTTPRAETMNPRAIDDQIADILAGRLTADDVASEGVHPYAVKCFEPDTAEGWTALRAIRAAVAARVADPVVTAAVPVTATVRVCACGHTSAHAMNTSSGLACPECYDRMSE